MTKTRIAALTATLLVCTASGLRSESVEATDTPSPVNGITEFIPVPSTELPDLGTEAAATSDRALISISLDDVELIDVVRMFSRIAAANIIANPEILTARVTVTLDNVEWRPALSSILSMHGLALLERPQGSGVFTVVAQLPDAPVPMQVKTIFLKYTTVDEVRPIVERMLSAGASISTFPSRNAMVLRDTEDKLTEITGIVEEIDILSKQVVVETQFMELSDKAIKQLGVRWDSLAELGLNFQAGPFSTTRSSESESSRTDGMDRRSTNYSFDGTDSRFNEFGERTESGAFTYPSGVSVGGPSESSASYASHSVNEQSQANYSEVVDGITRTVAQSSAAILNVDRLNIIMSALKETDGISIVSNPKIIVTSGSTNAFFSVGEREPIIRRTVLRGTAESPGDQVLAELDTSINTEYIRSGYLNTGIELLVVPTVKTDDLIEARIEPSLRRKIGEKVVDGNAWPEIAVKEIKTQFTLQSGQTVAIGGLTGSQESRQTSKVPLLGDIPIIGRYLFSWERDEKRQVETVIFVTLALADPMNIARNEGIPQRGELVHKREIKDSMRRVELQQELEDLQNAAKKIVEQYEKRKAAEAPAAPISDLEFQ
jgi:type IV pilus assembly protein PilQ